MRAVCLILLIGITAPVLAGCTSTVITAMHVNHEAEQDIVMECVEYDGFDHAALGIKDNLEKGWKPMLAGKKTTCFIWCSETIVVCYEKKKS